MNTTAKKNPSETKTEQPVKQPRISAVESKAHTPDQFVQAGTEAVKDFLTAGTEEAQRTHEKVLSFGRENMEKWAESADKAARTLGETLALSKEQIDALMESSKLATELGKQLHENLVKDMNTSFSENVELTKELLACRTLDDVMEVQSRALQNQLARFFDQSARLTDAWFKLSTDVVEPLNTQATQVTNRLNKSIAA